MELTDFSSFSDSLTVSPTLSLARSYLNKAITYGVRLEARVGQNSGLEKEVWRFRFDEALIVALTEELGLDMGSQRHKVKAAEILAIRNAWVGLLQGKFAGLERRDIELALSGANTNIAIDFVTLSFGFNHPWIEEKVHLLQIENHPDPNDFRDPEDIMEGRRLRSMLEQKVNHDSARLESQREESTFQSLVEDGIAYWIDEFGLQDRLWRSEYEPDAYHAEQDIKAAKQKINELKKEIEAQEGMIYRAQVPIRRFKNHEKLKKTKSAQLEAAKKKQFRKEVARKFFTMWVASLIQVLEVDSPAGLSRVTGVNKMAWWRRLHGKTVPPYTQISLLLDTTIKHPNKSSQPCPYAGKRLGDIPTYPTSHDLMELLKLI